MSLNRSVASFSAMTLISRVLGLVRDVTLSRVFGASAATDAFFVAFKIPNFLRRLFAEGSFSQAFVPVLAEYRQRGDHAELKALIDAVTGGLLAVLMLLTALMMLFAPELISVLAPGFADQPEQRRLAGDLLRITFPYLPLIALTALAGGILNTLGRFALPALTPALLNLALITAALVFSGRFEQPVEALAWGVLAAGLLQLAIQLPALARHGLLPRPRIRFTHPGVRRVLRLMAPTLFGSSVAQLNLLLDVLLASLLAEASISWLYYGDRLMEFPLGLFGVALSVVVLPSLAALHARADRGAFIRVLDWSVRMGLVVALPAMCGLVLLAGPIVTTLFDYGRFDDRDVAMAALALSSYCLGLPAFIGVKILAPAFFARQDAVTPVRIGLIAIASNMVLNVVFVLAITHWFAGGDWSGGLLYTLGAHPGAHAGLALASGTSAWLNAGLLWRCLSREGLAPRFPWRTLVQVVLACVAMTGLLWMITPVHTAWLDHGLWWRVGWLAALVIGGMACYALVCLTLGLRPAELLHRPDPNG
ncbi:MAG: murein biosynthesis integral membrane protein MurJ [Wenzhouxiangellaceae bacterium]